MWARQRPKGRCFEAPTWTSLPVTVPCSLLRIITLLSWLEQLRNQIEKLGRPPLYCKIKQKQDEASLGNSTCRPCSLSHQEKDLRNCLLPWTSEKMRMAAQPYPASFWRGDVLEFFTSITGTPRKSSLPRILISQLDKSNWETGQIAHQPCYQGQKQFFFQAVLLRSIQEHKPGHFLVALLPLLHPRKG